MQSYLFLPSSTTFGIDPVLALLMDQAEKLGDMI